MESLRTHSRMKDMLKGIGIGIILTLLSLSSITYAATGGKFGEILNLILTGNKVGVSGRTWDNAGGNYMVENARTLSGNTLDKFQTVNGQGQSCGTNQCMYGFDTTGKILCR